MRRTVIVCAFVLPLRSGLDPPDTIYKGTEFLRNVGKHGFPSLQDTSNLAPTECLFPAFLTITDIQLAGHGLVGDHVIRPVTMGEYQTTTAI